MPVPLKVTPKVEGVKVPPRLVQLFVTEIPATANEATAGAALIITLPKVIPALGVMIPLTLPVNTEVLPSSMIWAALLLVNPVIKF